MVILNHVIRMVVSALSLYQSNALWRDLTLSDEGSSECPGVYNQIEFSSNCTVSCPRAAPLQFQQLCLAFCPYGYQYNSPDTCSNATGLIDDKSSNHCQVVTCPSDKPLCYDTQCLSVCPNGTLPDEGNCMHDCSDTSPLVLNDSCVSSCPADSPYNEYGHCVSACSTRYFLHGQTCFRTCPQHTHQYLSTCVDVCPPEAPKSLGVWNISLCVTSCPEFTSTNGSKCEIQCPNGQDYLWNGSCVRECPVIAPYVYVLTRRLPPYVIPICTPVCPDHYYIEANHCVPTCSPARYLMNSTCEASCPETHPYFTGKSPPFTCVQSCNRKQILNIDHCVKSCPIGRLIFNRTCVDDCPVTHIYKVNQTCLSRCPSPMVVYNGSCQSSCPSIARYSYNGQCISVCPNSHPSFRRTQSGNVVCQTTAICPEGEFTWNNQCFYQCPDNTVFINSTCLRKCPLSHKLKYRSDKHRSVLAMECVAECAENTFMKEDFCFDHCDPPLVGFPDNNTCLERCPDSHKWRSVTTTNSKQLAFTCVANCSAPRLVDNDKCHFTCPDSKPFAVNQTCLKSCPNDSSLRTPFGNGMTCSKTCPETYIQENDTCVLKCSHGKVIINKVCVDVTNCANEYQFIEYSPHGTICRKRCLDNQFVDNIQCVTSCPSFSVGQLCVETCPSDQKFTRGEHNSSDGHADRKCYEECPSKTYANGTKCMAIDCPMKYLADSRTCVSSCTISHPYLEELFKCVNKCSDGYIIMGRTCIRESFCLKDKGFFVYDKQCVNSCPTGTFVNYIRDGCILSSIVYLLIVTGVICTVLLTSGAVWFYYSKKRKNCKTCFSMMQ
ncbi:proprotein convertase subtilisin/kexin type 5-like, partial [Mizuhopecten yessoensis]|uniref:proprotein convertase subtilisin/kexin type 5-like n=1 Tax=Mizuhopecten yessoensis TaxID=6573 RepID=UPI000B45BB04